MTKEYTRSEIAAVIGSQRGKLIDELADNLDYDKMRSLMECLDWKWASLSPPRIPTQIEVYKEVCHSINRLLDEMAEKAMQTSALSRGGIEVSAEIDEDSEGTPKLYGRVAFIVSDWENYE